MPFIKLARCFVFTLVLLGSVWVSSAAAAVVVVAEPGALENDVRNVQYTAEAFSKIVAQDMNVPLMRGTVRIISPAMS